MREYLDESKEEKGNTFNAKTNVSTQTPSSRPGAWL
jgi:hypothetical protein